MKASKTIQSIIGSCFMVRDLKHGRALVEARAIDETPEHRAKRLRLLTGEHNGEVLMPNEYQVLERVEHAEAAGVLALAWP